jgi:predicted negative regulator of RcsB-dependent stress response
MPQTLIVIFLLFFAVLALAWFYWQRAKARSVRTESVEPAEQSDAPPSA